MALSLIVLNLEGKRVTHSHCYVTHTKVLQLAGLVLSWTGFYKALVTWKLQYLCGGREDLNLAFLLNTSEIFIVN